MMAGAATEAGGRQSLTLAIVAGSFVLAASIVGPVVTEWFRQRLRKPPVDHRDELISEQSEFIEHLRTELAEARAEAEKPRRRRG